MEYSCLIFAILSPRLGPSSSGNSGGAAAHVHCYELHMQVVVNATARAVVVPTVAKGMDEGVNE